MQLLIINGQTFEILETIKSTLFDKEEKIVMHNDRVGLLLQHRCLYIEGVEEWLIDTKEAKWINKEQVPTEWHSQNLSYIGIFKVNLVVSHIVTTP
jgi:ligand-binding sensor protein